MCYFKSSNILTLSLTILKNITYLSLYRQLLIFLFKLLKQKIYYGIILKINFIEGSFMRKRILSFCLLFSLLFGNNIVNAN